MSSTLEIEVKPAFIGYALLRRAHGHRDQYHYMGKLMDFDQMCLLINQSQITVCTDLVRQTRQWCLREIWATTSPE